VNIPHEQKNICSDPKNTTLELNIATRFASKKYMPKSTIVGILGYSREPNYHTYEVAIPSHT